MNNIDNNQFMGQPKGLFYLFFAELWERFSFYGMRALLILYMTKHLLYTDKMSFGVFAAYGSIVYATPLIGGMIADKILGYRKAIILGGILMALGHFLLAIDNQVSFYLSLGFIIVGNGFFKPNISSFVGALYPKGDVRRDAGFTIFYMGINIGGMLAPLMCAWLAEQYGWHYGFGLAGIGMLVGLYFFYGGIQKNVFGDKGLIANEKVYNSKSFGLSTGTWVPILAIASVPVFALIVRYYQYEHFIVWIVTFVVFAILYRIYEQVSKEEKGRLLVVVYFTILCSIFWAVFEQGGSSLTLFADRNVNLVGLNASQTNSLNSTFIILLSIPFAMLWPYLKRIHKNPSSPVKFGIGLIMLGLGFIIFSISGRAMDSTAHVPMFYLVFGYFIYTIGEMFLSPIGLSKMTELSPTKYLSFIMGVWFLSSFYGHFFAGKIATLTATGKVISTEYNMSARITHFLSGIDPTTLAEKSDALAQLYKYLSVYSMLGVSTILIGIIALMLSPKIKIMMHGIE